MKAEELTQTHITNTTMSGNIMIHCGGNIVSREDIQAMGQPVPMTETHFPLRHEHVISTLENSLRNAGFQLGGGTHALDKEGMRYFGVLQIKSQKVADFQSVIGLRNSHDQRFSVGVCAGSRVFVCDNLSFYGELSSKRKHTRNVEADFPVLVDDIMEQLRGQIVSTEERIDAYKSFDLSDERADHEIVRLAADSGAITYRNVEGVVKEWEEPSHEEFQPRNAWSLFNAVTEVHKGIRDASTLLERGNKLHRHFDKLVGLN